MSKKDSELQNDANRQKENLLGTIFLSVLSVLFIVIGVCMLFVQKIQIVYLLYAIAAIIIVLGIGMMIRYYVRQAYRNVHDYSFSCGALLVILGGCGLVRADELVKSVPTLVGMLVLILSIIMMQRALQILSVAKLCLTADRLKAMPLSKMLQAGWIAIMILSILTLIEAILLLCGVSAITGRIDQFEYWALMISGILMLGSQLISEIGVRRFTKKEAKLLARIAAEAEQKTDEEEALQEQKQKDQRGEMEA